MIRTINVTRYVMPLREGGSLPAIVEGDDDGTYVLKFRGAGQGARALIAELIGGELARALGLPVPEIVFAQLDARLAQTEPDPEIQDLLRASAGLNLALDYLPGSIAFDPLLPQSIADKACLASSIVWFDALVTNVDRTARNTNLLVWHRNLWLIDHGAALYFHHSWDEYLERSRRPFPQIQNHVLLLWASELRAVDGALSALLTEGVLAEILAAIPDDWLRDVAQFATPQEHRAAYHAYLLRRLQAPREWAEEAIRATTVAL